MGDIIEFKKKQSYEDNDSYVSPYETEDGYFCIDSTSNNKDFPNNVGEFWLNIVTGQKITEVFAEEDGKIYFKLSWLKQAGADFKDYIDHVAFLIIFLNKNSDVLTRFMKEYDSFLEESGSERIIAFAK